MSEASQVGTAEVFAAAATYLAAATWASIGRTDLTGWVQDSSSSIALTIRLPSLTLSHFFSPS